MRGRFKKEENYWQTRAALLLSPAPYLLKLSPTKPASFYLSAASEGPPTTQQAPLSNLKSFFFQAALGRTFFFLWRTMSCPLSAWHSHALIIVTLSSKVLLMLSLFNFELFTTAANTTTLEALDAIGTYRQTLK
jgi:hypothetical protein